MNQYPGVIGRKLGMTQVFAEDGSVIACTVVESKPVIVGKRTREKDGYDALILGIGEPNPKRLGKALTGMFQKANVAPRRTLRELRCTAEYAAGFEVGQELKLEQVFQVGQFVDVQGVSRGRGFTGVMRRHNFAGNVQTHGTHEYRRHGGSIGTRLTPGRVKLGTRMAGHSGAETFSVLSQRVVKVLPEENLLFIRGGIPGPRDGLVVVRGAAKRAGGIPKPKAETTGGKKKK
ncbi:MAG TPA: 50S ribosomal protein L3 [Polyangiaceae bacterium]|nr:50S ribosomal protein L3 [Polyangiaceae bacterium]